MRHASVTALLVLSSVAAHAGDDHAHPPAAPAAAAHTRDLKGLPAAERARVEALSDALEAARAVEQRGNKAALTTLRQRSEQAQKRGFERTKELYGRPAFSEQAARVAAVRGDKLPEDLASPTLAWLEDACGPAGSPQLALRYALCADAYAHEAAAHPGDYRVHALWRDANAAVEAHDTAFVAAWIVAELRPQEAAAWYRAAQLGMLADAPREATGAVYRAIGIEVDEVFVAGFAESLAKRKALPTAVQTLEAAIAKKPRSGRLLAMQALLMAGGGRADLALKTAERAAKTGYEGADLYLAWGLALHAQERPDEALVKLRAAVALDPAARDDVPPELRGRL